MRLGNLASICAGTFERQNASRNPTCPSTLRNAVIHQRAHIHAALEHGAGAGAGHVEIHVRCCLALAVCALIDFL